MSNTASDEESGVNKGTNAGYQISGFGAFGFLLMIFGALIGSGIHMFVMLGKAELSTALAWGVPFGAVSLAIFLVEAIRAINQKESQGDKSLDQAGSS